MCAELTTMNRNNKYEAYFNAKKLHLYIAMKVAKIIARRITPGTEKSEMRIFLLWRALSRKIDMLKKGAHLKRTDGFTIIPSDIAKFA